MWPLIFALVVAQPEPEEWATIPPALEPALTLLRPHLEWQAPAVPPVREERLRIQQAIEKHSSDEGPWQAALGAPKAWKGDIPKALIESVERQAKAHPDRPPLPPLSAYAWRLKNPGHADVAKALALLEAVRDDRTKDLARRWAAEIRRNNTVLTLDVGGAFAVGKPVKVVLDARNTDRVMIRLYRLTTAEDLLRVLDRIGTDFIFRLHEFEQGRDRKLVAERALEKLDRVSRAEPPPLPEALTKKPLAEWPLPLDPLKRIPPHELRDLDDREDEEEDDDQGYGDRCGPFRQRLQREYLEREPAFSTWRAGLIVEIPGRHLEQAGAYLLQVEANGQFALAPLLVDPPALTLRRCPDGVLAVVGDAGGEKPLVGAALQARKHREAATTDAAGVAFLRVVGRGDRAIVAEHRGRFAVGGFGAVFRGIYHDPDRDWGRGIREQKKQVERRLRDDALVYANGLVVGLWTDRSRYRPGDTVRARMIVRQRVPAANGAGFRTDDFDAPKLELLPVDTPVAWELLGSGDAALPEGKWKLNDFGTAAGTFRIPEKAAAGEITLRVRIDQRTCLLPDQFTVDDRLAVLAEIEVQGLPETLGPGQKLPVTLVARYPGGLPLGGGTVTVHLANESTRWNLTPDPVELDRTGQARPSITLPVPLPSEKMALRVTVTDPSGTRTTRTIAVKVEAGALPLLGGLPRVIAGDQPVEWACDTEEIELEQGRPENDGALFRTTRIPVVNRRASFRFPGPGWYTVRAGREEKEVFVFGGTQPPWATCTRRQHQAEDDVSPWVDLAHYAAQEGGSAERDNRRPLLALFPFFDRSVGQTLPVLVYVPFDSARVLLTLEGHSVVDYSIVNVEGRTNRYHLLQIPLKDRHRPHVYVQGTILGGRPGKPDEQPRDRLQKAIEHLDDEYGEDPAWCKVHVRGPDRPDGIRVELTTNKPVYEPGETVTVSLRTLDPAGRPVMTEVSLAAVETRLFAMERDRLPDLLAAFRGTRGAERFQRKTWRTGVGIREAAQARERLQKMADQARAAQKAVRSLEEERLLEGPSRRTRADRGELPVAIVPLGPPRLPGTETAFATPQLRTDAEGRATVRFLAPLNLSTYRVTAFALTRSGQVGMGEAGFRSGKPLEVEVHLPPEVIEGSTIEVPVQVRNFTDRARRVDLAILLRGLDHPGNQAPRLGAILIPAGSATTVRVNLEARKEGTGTLTVRAEDPAHDDAETRTTRIVKPRPAAKAEKKPEENRQ